MGKPTKFIVTGGAGFIASHIAEHLLKRGFPVTVLDNFSTGKHTNLGFIQTLSPEEENRFEIIEGDIRDLDIVKQAVTGASYIIHHAAVVSVSESVFDPLLTNEVNLGGTLNVLMAAKETGAKRVVFASSSAIYDDQYEGPHMEDRHITPYSSPYALSKYMGELYGNLFAKLYGLEIVFLRYFNVYGPRQDPDGEYAAVIPKFITALLKKEKPIIYGNGKQTRDFVYVDDVVKANVLACKIEGISAEAFNIAQGNNTSVNKLLYNIKNIMEADIQPERSEKRPGDVMYSIADISRAKKLLGFKPRVTINQGLKTTIEWFRKHAS